MLAVPFEGEKEVDYDSPVGPAVGKTNADVVSNPPSLPILTTPPVPYIPDHPKRVCNPSQAVHNILSGISADHDVPQGVQMPTNLLFKGEDMPSDDERDEVERGLLSENGMAVLTEHALAAITSDAEALEPHTLQEACTWPDWLLWEKVIEEELEMLCTAGTWVFEEAPTRANIIGSKWVFKAKKDVSGNIVQYKAHLVTQGFSQVPGVDYFDTYTPVAKLPLIWTILAIMN